METGLGNDDDSKEVNNFGQEEDSYRYKKKAKGNKDTKKRKAREENVQEALTSAFTILGDAAEMELKFWERINAGQLIVSSADDTREVVGGNSMQDMESLMACLKALEELDGIDGASFVKALKILKEDSLWRDLFVALSDGRKKDFVLYI